MLISGHGRNWGGVYGRFLALFSDKAGGRIFGIVRHVGLHQFGHFMMGSMKIRDQRLTLSGDYGADGLTRNLEEVSSENREHLTEMPDELAQTFWKDDTGWNSAGVSGVAVAEWGRSIDKYARPRK